MYTQRQLLEKALTNNSSNYTELAKALGVTRQAMSQYKLGGPMSIEIALKLARQLPDFDPAEVVLCTEHNKAMRSEKKEAVKIWESLYKRIQKSKN